MTTQPCRPKVLHYTTRDHLKAMLRLEVLVLVPIYCLGLIPFTVLLAWLSRRMDCLLGLPSLAQWLPHSTRLAILLVCLAIGGLWIAWVYTFLVLEGGGGPVPPFSSRSSTLVMCGPYALARHPSVWGKLLGVVGLGVYVASPFFLFVMIPLLCTFSFTYTLRAQDRDMVKFFGAEYLRYRERTPFILPRMPWR